MHITKEKITKKVTSINNKRILLYKYLGPTNTKQARVKIIDKWYGKSITIRYSYDYDTAYEEAIAYLIERGWPVFGKNTENKVIIMSEWNSDKQLK
tara:strand:- start:491 stop:778 length:288 start_codon:yes stop_codon:yes gene_type:complete